MPQREWAEKTENGENLYSVHYSPAERQARQVASSDAALFPGITIRAAVPSDFASIQKLSTGMAGYLQAHFGSAMKKANFDQVCERISKREAQGNPPATEQLVAVEQGQIVGFVRLQHRPEENASVISHMFAISSGQDAKSPVADDPKTIAANIPRMLEREASERARKSGSTALLVNAGNYNSWIWNETFPGYRRADGTASAPVLTKHL